MIPEITALKPDPQWTIKFQGPYGENGWLSLKFPLELRVHPGYVYKTAEHMFHHLRVKRWNSSVANNVLETEDPAEASRIAHAYLQSYNRLESVGKASELMRKVLVARFAKEPRMRELLAATFEPIQFASHDSFWGAGKDGQGLNLLGLLYMELRSTIQVTTTT